MRSMTTWFCFLQKYKKLLPLQFYFSLKLCASWHRYAYVPLDTLDTVYPLARQPFHIKVPSHCDRVIPSLDSLQMLREMVNLKVSLGCPSSLEKKMTIHEPGENNGASITPEDCIDFYLICLTWLWLSLWQGCAFYFVARFLLQRQYGRTLSQLSVASDDAGTYFWYSPKCFSFSLFGFFPKHISKS